MKKIIPFDNLYTTDFEAKIINSLKQNWIIQNKFSCLDTPKHDNLFLYFHSCCGKYTLPDGSTFTAPRGSLVYAPIGSKYEVVFYDTDNSSYNTVGVSFYVYDNLGVSFNLADDVIIFDVSKQKQFHTLFSELAQVFSQSLKSPVSIKAKFYSLISEICKFVRHEKIRSTQFNVISKGITYLEENYLQDLSIKQIAKMCNVSEIYFRRLFKQYSGISPVQYKLNAKIELAKHYLNAGNLSICEISDLVGFNSTAYFCKFFKERTGYTPKEYIKNNAL